VHTAVTWTQNNQGIYDPYCAQAGDNWHELLGNSYMMHGLLAAAVVARQIGDAELLNEARNGEELLLGHLVATTQKLDPQRGVWAYSTWSSGELYYVVEQWQRQIGPLTGADICLDQAYRRLEVLCLRNPFNVKTHASSMIAEYIFSCDEYVQARARLQGVK